MNAVFRMLIRNGVTLEQRKSVFLTCMHQDHFGRLPDMVKFRINRFRDKDLQIFLTESAAMETNLTFTDCRIIPMPQVSRKNNVILSKKRFFPLDKKNNKDILYQNFISVSLQLQATSNQDGTDET